MSICACARSRSYCEIKGCLSHPEHGYYRPRRDGDPVRLPWSPRFVGMLADHRSGKDDMIMYDTLMRRAASVPGPPEKVVPAIFRENRRGEGGFIFVHYWNVEDSFEPTWEHTVAALAGNIELAGKRP